MALIQDGSGGGGVLAVDSVSKAARVTFYDTKGNPILYSASEQVDHANQSGLLAMGVNNKSILPQRLDNLGSQASANIMPLLNDSFDGSTLSTQRWTVYSANMAASQGTGAGVVINSGSVVAANSGYLMRSARPYLKCIRQPLCCRTRARLSTASNSIGEFGFGDVSSAIGSSTTGAYWQVTTTGAVIPVLEFNNTVQTGTDIRSLLNAVGMTTYFNFDVIIDDEFVTFVCTDSGTGTVVSQQRIALASTGIRLLSSTQISYFAHLYISGTAATTVPLLSIGDVAVWSLDNAAAIALPHLLASQSRGGDVNPLTGAQLMQWPNSAELGNSTLSNAAPSFSNNPGGKFQFAALVGSVNDYALFVWQVPAGTNYHVTSIDFDVWNTGAPNGATPTVLEWAVAAGMTTNQIAAATSRVPVGAHAIPASSPIGFVATRVSKSYQVPLFTAAGRFFAVILRVPVGLATANQVIQGMVCVEGYFN